MVDRFILTVADGHLIGRLFDSEENGSALLAESSVSLESLNSRLPPLDVRNLSRIKTALTDLEPGDNAISIQGRMVVVSLKDINAAFKFSNFLQILAGRV